MANGASVFSAELTAILQAILFTREIEGNKILICSDSQSTLKAISKMYAKTSLVLRIQDVLAESEKSFMFLWIPSHVGIRGNETADESAKRGRKSQKTGLETISREDLKHKTKLRTWEKWMRELLKTKNRVFKLRGKVRREEKNQLSRRDAMIISRLRIGHTRVTHRHLMTNEQPPVCVCGENFTVDHILGCTNADMLRNAMGLVGNEMLTNLDSTNAKKSN